MSPRSPLEQSPREELANALTHAVGTALAVAGLVILVVLAAREGDPWMVTSFSIYGASLIGLYLASTLYHTFRSEKTKRYFKQLDHSFIYILIAGTYTPVLLVLLRDSVWGWTLFGVIWALAVAGVAFKILFIGRFRAISTIVYLLMGWMIVVAWKPVLAAMPEGMMTWIAVGGGCYTLGVVFYQWRAFPYHHAVWHLFVLGGSVSHWVAMLKLVG